MPAAEALPTRSRRRRRGAAGRRFALAVVGAGAALLLGGGVLMAAPVWSGLWNAAAQRAAAGAFARAVQRARGTAPAAAPSSGGTLPGPPPVWPFLEPAEAGVAPAPASAAAPGGPVLARLVIPAIGVDSYVLRGLTFQPSVWSALLRQGPSHLQGSAAPGAPGNVVILGHLNVWGSVFLRLHRLAPGDLVYLQTPTQTYTYRVTGHRQVSPSDVAVLAPHGGSPTLELATCAGLFDTQRLVVSATLLPPAGQAAATGLGAARALVQRFLDDRITGRLDQAYALLGPAWASRTDAAGLGADAPVRASVQGAWASATGGIEVLVQAQAASAPRPETVAFTVAGGRIQSSRVVTSSPVVVLPAVRPASARASASGALLCGGYRVAWRVGPVGTGESAGFAFPQRSSSVRVVSPQGRTLGGLQIPGLALGTYPVACGDLLGDGGQALILRTVINAAGGTRVAVYALSSAEAALIGQMAGGGDVGPILRQISPGGPYALGVGQTDGGRHWWVPSGGRFVRAAGPPSG